jgi:protein-disulfide isomerase
LAKSQREEDDGKRRNPLGGGVPRLPYHRHPSLRRSRQHLIRSAVNRATPVDAGTDAGDSATHPRLSSAKSKVIVAALRNLQQKMVREKQVTAQEMAVAKQHDLVGDPTSPIGGNPQGDVTIVEFFDYRCPYCKAVEPSVEELLEEDAKLRIVYKEFPILGPRVGLCGKGCARRGKTRKIHVVP